MKTQEDYEYRYNVIFPESKAYAVDDVLNFIATVEQQLDSKEKKDHARNEFKANLINRLLKSVIEGEFELWNMSLNKVMAPPLQIKSESITDRGEKEFASPINVFLNYLFKKFARPTTPNFEKILNQSNGKKLPQINPTREYKTNFWWARMTFIYRADLIKFCKAQRINANFETEVDLAIVQEKDNDLKSHIKDNEKNELDTNYLEISQPKQEQKIDTHLAQEHVEQESIKINTSEAVIDVPDISVTQYFNEATSNQVGKSNRNQRKAEPAERKNLLNGFDDLPDSTYININVVAAYFDISTSTVERRTRAGILKKHQFGERDTRWLVREIREIALRMHLDNTSCYENKNTPLSKITSRAETKSINSAINRNETTDDITLQNTIQETVEQKQEIESDSKKIHKLKDRWNLLDAIIDTAIHQAGNSKTANVHLCLKEIALGSEPPFTGRVEGDKLYYTNIDNKDKYIDKDRLSSRLSRRLKLSSK